jgi:hypothetical protein
VRLTISGERIGKPRPAMRDGAAKPVDLLGVWVHLAVQVVPPLRVVELLGEPSLPGACQMLEQSGLLEKVQPGSDFAKLLTQKLSDAVPRELADQSDRGGDRMGRQRASGVLDERLSRRRNTGRLDDEAGPDVASAGR